MKLLLGMLLLLFAGDVEGHSYLLYLRWPC